MRGVTTFGAFTTARLGILASQKALDVTGHNISNINTLGYTRQSLDQISLRTGGYDMLASTFASNIGCGALPTGVSQLRDPYLDIRYRNEAASVGFMDAKLNGLEELKNIIDEVGKDEGGMLDCFDDILKQLSNLTGDQASEDATQSLVRESSDTLVKLLRSAAERLSDVKENQETKLNEEVDKINGILSQIQELNDSIFKSDIHGDNALELRDQRNVLLDELSQYMKIDVTYESVSLGAGTTVDKLVIKLADKPPHDHTLVDGGYVTKMEAADAEHNYDLTLKALTNAKGKVLDGSGDVGLLDTDSYGALQATREMLTEMGEFTQEDTVAGVDPDAAGKRGIPYYQNALDALANKFATLMNEANTGYMYNSDGNYVKADGTELQVGGVSIPKTTDLKDPANAALKAALEADGIKLGGTLFSNSGAGDDTTGITAANISISKSWDSRVVKIQNSFVMANDGTDGPPHVGTTDNDNILHMMNVITGKYGYTADETTGGGSVNGGEAYITCSFQDYWTNVQQTLGKDQKETSTMLNNFYAAATELDVSRQGVAGVDLNDEAMSMMQYQKSYSAACRMMTTVDEILDKLINGTGIVGR